MDRLLIEQYEAGGGELRAAVDGLSPDALPAFPVPGTWSIQQIVHHLVDSDLIHADRMKRIIAEENPQLIGFDESKFAANLHYHQQSVNDGITIFDLNRRNFARVLRQLPDLAFDRVGTHNERGPMTLADLLSDTVDHLSHHLKFIAQKRKMLS